MTASIRLTPSNTLPHQYAFATAHPELVPYPAIVGGYGSGKSMSVPLRWLCLIEYRAKKRERCKLFVVEPTYKMVSMVMVKTFDKFFDSIGIKHSYHKTAHCYTIWYRKHSFECYFYSAERAESIAGINMTDCVIDEFDLIRTEDDQANVYNQCLARLRESKDGTLGIVTTPEGFKYTYELYQQKHVGNAKYKLIRAKTTDNFFLPDSYIQGLRDQFDSLLIQRYLNGEFVNLNNMAAYYAFNRERDVKPVAKPKGRDIVAGMDFNVDPMATCMGYFDGANLPIFSEYFMRNANTYAMVEAMKADYAGYNICTYPDPSGKSRKTSADISDIEIIKRAGFDCDFVHGLTQKRRLAYINNWFDKGRITIDPSCDNLIRDLEQVTTDSYGQIDKSSHLLTHISDALTNIVATREVNETRQKGRII